MSNKLNAKKISVAQHIVYSFMPRSLIYSAMTGALFLSLSQMTNATDTDSLQKTLGNGSAKIFPPIGQNALTTSSIKSSFIRDIRAAIAAKWQKGQIDNLVDFLVVQQSSQAEAYQDASEVPRNSFKPFIGQNLSYDSNILRVADGGDAEKVLAGRSKSDFIKQIRAGIAAKWSIQRQALLVKAMVSQNWYSTYHELDYLGRDIQIRWDWQLGRYLTGEIGYNNKVSREAFSQINSLSDNLQTRNGYFASGEYQFFSNWFLQGGFTHLNTSYNANLFQINALTTEATMVGLKYLTPNKNQLGITATLTDGKFPNRVFVAGNYIDNAYTRNDFNFEWAWQYSVKTGFDGTIGYMQQSFEHLHQRDFSAPTVNANLSWEVTAKTSLRLSGWREIQFVNSQGANFLLTQGLRVSTAWIPTPKLQFTLPLSYEKQEYLGDPGFIKTAGAEQDKVSKIGLNVDYNPIENAKVSLFMQFEDRTSTTLSRNYQSNAVGLDMQLDF
ncbi:MAG: outer membrane beta-barrel protein [Methylococcaceae bacterium]|nr:outer membrane beta-barrel protein [Methylococcaceae bacterium]